MLLKSDRIRLRAVEPEDLDLMYLVENDTSLWEGTTNTAPFSYAALRTFLADSRGDLFIDRQLRLVVESLDRLPCGFLDLQNFDPLNQRAEVGIVLLPEQQHKGYAAESLRLLADYAATHLHLHQLYAYVAEGNTASSRLFERSGYTHTATLPQWLRTPKGWQNVRLYQLTL